MIHLLLKRITNLMIKYQKTGVITIFIISSLLFSSYMIFIEGLSLIDTWYFMITTATTVGYGDISPQTPFGRIIFPIYMLVGIGTLAVIITDFSEKIFEYNLKKRKGNSRMKNHVDLMIIGYPSEDKVKSIISQLDTENKEMNIVLLNDTLDEIPTWVTDMRNIKTKFIKGLGSDVNVLKKANIEDCDKALILAKDVNNISSDDYNSSAVAVIEHLNENVYTIVEKVREDDILYSVSKADLIIPVSSANIIAQEIIDPGAIDLVNALFDNNTLGTQFNFCYNSENTTWIKQAMEFLSKGYIPEGFKNPNDKKFNLMPQPNDIIETGAVIKYRGSKRIDS